MVMQRSNDGTDPWQGQSDFPRRAFGGSVTWAGVILAILSWPTAAQAGIKAVELTGGGLIGGPLFVETAVLNNEGQVAYMRSQSLGLFPTPESIRYWDGQTNYVLATVGNNELGPGPGQYKSFSLDAPPLFGGSDDVFHNGFRLNDNGHVMFHAQLTGDGVNNDNDSAIYVIAANQGATQIAREGQLANVNGEMIAYTNFDALALDNHNERVYIAELDDSFGGIASRAIFRRQTVATQLVAVSGQESPGGGPEYLAVGFNGIADSLRVDVNDNTGSAATRNKVAFFTAISTPASVDFGRIYRGSAPSQIVEMSAEGNSIFGGKIEALYQPDLNDNGWVAYKIRSSLIAEISETKKDAILATATAPSLATLILAEEDQEIRQFGSASGLVFTGFGDEPVVNNANKIAFFATFNGPGNHNHGIFKQGTGPSRTPIAEQGDFPSIPGPDNLPFVEIEDKISINDHGQVAFTGYVGGDSTAKGLYVGVGGGKPAVEMVRVGQPFDGSTIVALNAKFGPELGGNTGFNENGQIAFQGRLADGRTGIFVVTPTLKLSLAAAKFRYLWDRASEWNLNMLPNEVHDVAIGDEPSELPLRDFVVEGPTQPTTINNFDLGARGFNPQPEPPKLLFNIDFGDGPGAASSDANSSLADHREAPLLTTDGNVTIHPIGELHITGFSTYLTPVELPAVLVAQDASNHGRIILAEGGSLKAAELINEGLVQGDGVIDAGLTNRAGGTVQSLGGDRLILSNIGATGDDEGSNAGSILAEAESILAIGGILHNRDRGMIKVGNTARALFGKVINDGQVMMQPHSFIKADEVVNNGRISGAGDLCARVVNRADGLVVIADFEELLFTDTLEPNLNEGRIIVGQQSALRVSGSLHNQAGGQMVIREGGLNTITHHLVNRGSIDSHGFVDVLGSLSGNGIGGSGSTRVGGKLSPGFSPGFANFGGNLFLRETAEVEIEIGGLTPGTQHDQVRVGRSLALDGNLHVELIDDFVPQHGDIFDIMIGREIDGWFDSFTGNVFRLEEIGHPELALVPRLFRDSNDGPDVVKLLTTGMGDANGDGRVTFADFRAIQLSFGTIGGVDWFDGDFNDDDRITFADFSLFQLNFGVTYFTLPNGPGDDDDDDGRDDGIIDASQLVVPEPGTAVVLMLSAFFAARPRRRRCRVG